MKSVQTSHIRHRRTNIVSASERVATMVTTRSSSFDLDQIKARRSIPRNRVLDRAWQIHSRRAQDLRYAKVLALVQLSRHAGAARQSHLSKRFDTLILYRAHLNWRYWGESASIAADFTRRSRGALVGKTKCCVSQGDHQSCSVELYLEEDLLGCGTPCT